MKDAGPGAAAAVVSWAWGGMVIVALCLIKVIRIMNFYSANCGTMQHVIRNS